MISTKSTNVADMLTQLHELVDRIAAAAQTAAPVSFEAALGGRHADLIADYANVAVLVSQLRFGPVYSFGRSDISYAHLDRGASTMDLIELFYVLDEPSVGVYFYDDGAAIVFVQGKFRGRPVNSNLKLTEPSAVDMLRASTSHPSIHVLRRLQIAGVR